MSSPRHSNDNMQNKQYHIDDALTFLQQFIVFRDTPLDVLKLYAYLSKRETFSRHEPILIQGEPCDRMYIIMSGEVSICEEHHGKNYHLQTLTADDLNYFGELALLTTFNWFFSAWAETDVTLLSISREAFQKIMERHPQTFSVAVEKIVRLRVERFIDQTDHLLEMIEKKTWEPCFHKHDQPD